MIVDYFEAYRIELGKMIRAERLLKGWNQDELAFYSGVSMRQVSEIESGKVRFNYETFLKIMVVGLGLTHPKLWFTPELLDVLKKMPHDRELD